MKHRLIAALLTLCLVFSLLDRPAKALAAAQEPSVDAVDVEIDWDLAGEEVGIPGGQDSSPDNPGQEERTNPADPENPDDEEAQEAPKEEESPPGDTPEGDGVETTPQPAVREENTAYSQALVDFIKTVEPFTELPYEADSGWYIGYGNSCDPLDWVFGITQEQAEELLRQSLRQCAMSVQRFLDQYGLKLSQNGFDALVSMTHYNGSAWLSISNRLPLFLSRGIEQYTEWEVVNAFAAWCHEGGKINSHQLSRRIAEAMMFLYGDYSGDSSAWCRLDVDAAGGAYSAIRSGGGTYSTDTFVYRIGLPFGSLPVTARNGYEFSGWRTESGAIITDSDIPAGDMHVTATWGQPSLFPDVPASSWFYDAVRDLVDKGVVQGFDDGYFHPQYRVTCGEILKLILLAAGYSVQQALSPGAHWASGYLDLADRRGYILNADEINLDAAVTRDDVAGLAAAVLRLGQPQGTTNPFSDTYSPSVLSLYEAGIVQGSYDAAGRRVYLGTSSITRAEIVVMVQRIYTYAKDHNVAVDDKPTGDPGGSGDGNGSGGSLERNPYNQSYFSTINGRVYYNDPAYDVRYGVDVSFYQGSINWYAAASDGIDFAMIRAGYRGGSQGTLNMDERFVENVRGAQSAGLDIGLYFFSQATTPSEAVEEAQYLLSLVRQYNVPVTFPLAFDWEPLGEGTRTESYDGSTLTSCAAAFCQTIQAAGYTPLIYSNPTMFYGTFDLGRLGGYDLWLANYVERTEFVYKFTMWQYTSGGSVRGINGRVDMDIAFVNYARR